MTFNNTVMIKRRPATGSIGSPTSLYNGELAFNEADNILYYGKGAGTGGLATSIEAIGGFGAYVTLNTPQTITGLKTFSGGINANLIGNADTATRLQTPRTFSLSNDGTGSTTFDGSANVTIPLTLSNTTVTAGTYGSSTTIGAFVVDAKGRLTNASTISIAFPVTSINTKVGAVVLTTTDISEGTNLYYTDARVRLNRLDQLAVPTTILELNNQRIGTLANPLNSQDAATKAYVDAVAQGAGNAPFTAVRAIATSSITLSGLQTIDGVALVANDRVLVNGNGAGNGIYVIGSGTWTRALDADASDEFRPGKQVFVNEGTANSDTTWSITNDGPITLGTSSITFTQISGLGQVVAGPGLSKTGNTISVIAGTGITTAANTIALSGLPLAINNLSTSGLIVRTAAGGALTRSIVTSGTGIFVSNGDALTGNPTIALQNSLASIGALTMAADRLPYYTGTTSSSAALTPFTATGRSLIGSTDAVGARTVLGLGDMSLQNANAVAITGGTVSNVTISNSIIDCGTF